MDAGCVAFAQHESAGPRVRFLHFDGHVRFDGVRLLPDRLEEGAAQRRQIVPAVWVYRPANAGAGRADLSHGRRAVQKGSRHDGRGRGVMGGTLAGGAVFYLIIELG